MGQAGAGAAGGQSSSTWGRQGSQQAAPFSKGAVALCVLHQQHWDARQHETCGRCGSAVAALWQHCGSAVAALYWFHRLRDTLLALVIDVTTDAYEQCQGCASLQHTCLSATRPRVNNRTHNRAAPPPESGRTIRPHTVSDTFQNTLAVPSTHSTGTRAGLTSDAVLHFLRRQISCSARQIRGVFWLTYIMSATSEKLSMRARLTYACGGAGRAAGSVGRAARFVYTKCLL